MTAGLDDVSIMAQEGKADDQSVQDLTAATWQDRSSEQSTEAAF